MKIYTLNTSADSQFFSRLINLIGSVKLNSQADIQIKVWDLGLTCIQLMILKLMHVQVIKVPQFVSFWKDCYTWKIYVLANSHEDIFLHLDAGNTVLCDLTLIFNKIEKEDFFFIMQGDDLRDIAPKDYFKYFDVSTKIKYPILHGGNIGFKRKKIVKKILSEAYSLAKSGFCLGFSKDEKFRDFSNRFPVRECSLFRHDQTLLNLVMRKHLKTFSILPMEKYASLSISNNSQIFNNRGISYRYLRGNTNYALFILVLGYCIFIDYIVYKRFFLKLKQLLYAPWK
jgi:hypothetical protein